LEDDVHRLQPPLVIVHNSLGGSGLPEAFNVFEYLVYSGWVKDSLRTYRNVRGPAGWKVFERAL
jgi:hypothetical protein